ncbi:membrane protein [Actinoplanes lobatus]|uniref:Membrane protein n=1 Tax=Actinoplanes lobatus TaxID=113568 RepID=A0A7W7HR32_9ACTN|nr:putative sulfate exporter family transporter [Actinoplanes lobatus]MBB4755166.1 putative integral membrane protein (TIGR00698 family) [Actinoplanes lobatus]GGN96350.1 membrane protein [Actinoplanes lobatus]GIE45410.1 membrane protein [Actinoplanes lobatus]
MTATDVAAQAPAGRHQQPGLAPGLLMAAAGLGGALLGHRIVPQIGVLTWAVALGVAAANLNLLPQRGRAVLTRLTKRLLRAGVILLGFSVSIDAIAALGVPVIAAVAGMLLATLVGTTWLGTRMRLGGPRSLLIGTGVAICGAAAIAAMEDAAEADEEDVTTAIAMITLFGTIALTAFPLLRSPFGLDDVQYGVWTGASVHEVGQVVAAASPAGAAVVTVAVVVKLTRVLLLAPVVAGVSALRRIRSSRTGGETARPPLIPLFVLGFLACAGLRSTGVVPQAALGWIGTLQTIALGVALFGMGTSVHLASLVRRSKGSVLLAAAATLFITVGALGATLLVVHR